MFSFAHQILLTDRTGVICFFLEPQVPDKIKRYFALAMSVSEPRVAGVRKSRALTPFPFHFERLPRISDHSVLAFWLAAYGRFECRSKMMSTIALKKSKREPGSTYSRGKSSAAKILGTRTHCCCNGRHNHRK